MKSVNYTPEMEQAIKAASPLDIAKAKDLAEKLGRKPRSIIAKAISMGLPYNAAKPTRKDGSPVVRKAELVSAIEKSLSSGTGSLVASLSGSVNLPPLSLTSLTWCGLTMYLWNAFYTRNTLYIVSNVIGLILNSIMIGLILL